MSNTQGPAAPDEAALSLLQQFYEYDRDVPLDARVLHRDEHETYRREKVVFRGRHNRRAPGYLAIPTLSSPPYPCILIAHGMGGSKEDWAALESEDASLVKGLLSAGFAVLVLDGPCHGERTLECDYQSIFDYIRPNRYRELIVDWTIEYRLAIDYLASRPELDITRIGVFGHSLGGVVAYNLVGVEPRIGAAVVKSTLPLTHHYLQRIGWDETALLRMAPIAPQTFAPAIKNTPFLMLNGRTDAYGTVESIQALFESIGSPTKELVLLDSGHVLPAEHMPRVVEWFQRYLK